MNKQLNIAVTNLSIPFSQTDSVKAAKIIAGVSNYLTNSDWNFKERNVGIIAGSTEGVSGWITSNFLEKTVLNKVRR